jgi:pimeloyl-ACP methyl ester carboxylesterase
MKSTIPEGMSGALLRMKDRVDSRKTLRQFDKPALVIHGADDKMLQDKEARIMAEALSNGRLETIEAVGQMVNMEQSEKFNQFVKEFLENG